jgi:uncharacterized protein
MDKKTVVEIIGRFRDAIEARGIRLFKIILFGSYASDTQHEGSDIDLVVISEDFNGRSYWERVDILSETIYEIFAPIEATALTPDEWERGDSFVSNFAEHGEVLYAA